MVPVRHALVRSGGLGGGDDGVTNHVCSSTPLVIDGPDRRLQCHDPQYLCCYNLDATNVVPRRTVDEYPVNTSVHGVLPVSMATRPVSGVLH
jgi:hypothetical protein